MICHCIGALTDGRSVVTAGLSIVMFDFFCELEGHGGLSSFIFFAENVFLSPLFGYLMGRICIFLICKLVLTVRVSCYTKRTIFYLWTWPILIMPLFQFRCHDDVISQTLLTICFSYVVMIVAHEIIDISGVVSVLIYRLFYNMIEEN